MNNKILNKLRLNLTVMNTAVLIGLSIFIAVVFYVSVSIGRSSEINNTLEAYCAQLAGETDSLKTQKNKNTAEFEEALQKNAVSYVIWDETFTQISASNELGLEDVYLLQIIQRYVADHQTGYWNANYATADKDLRVCTYAFISEAGAMHTVQVIKDMSGEHNIWSGSLWIMLAAVCVSTAAAALCGYFLSGRSLIPIKENMVAQQEFMADASHELRTPIAVIRTNLEVVRSCDDETVESQRQWLDNAYQETKRMHHIVEDLMFLARSDAGEVHETVEQIDLGFLCAEVTERMMSVAQTKHIMLYTEISDDELLFDGDEKHLTQLLVILIDNAIKYSEENTAITVQADIKDYHYRIRVKDQGVGIAPDELEKVFQRFYRVDKTRSRAEGGTGLGLSIAAWITGHYGGSIKAISDGHNGTTMQVLLPVNRTGVKPDNNTKPSQSS